MLVISLTLFNTSLNCGYSWRILRILVHLICKKFLSFLHVLDRRLSGDIRKCSKKINNIMQLWQGRTNINKLISDYMAKSFYQTYVGYWMLDNTLDVDLIIGEPEIPLFLYWFYYIWFTIAVWYHFSIKTNEMN